MASRRGWSLSAGRAGAHTPARPWRVELSGHLLLLVLLLLVVYPLAMLLVGSVRSGGPGLPGDWSLQGYVNAYSDPKTFRTWSNSFILSAANTICSTIVGVLFAFIVARTDVPLRGIVTPVMTAVFILPPIFFAVAWALLGHSRAGLINQAWHGIFPGAPALIDAYSWPGMILVMSLRGAGFKFLLVLGAFKTMDLSLEEASRTAGASRFQTIRRIGLPILAPTILGAMMLTFIAGLQASETPLFLGFPAGIYVFSTRIIDYLTNYAPAQYPEAGALSLTGVIVMLLLVTAQWRFLGGREYTTVTGKGYRPDVWKLGKAGYIFTAFILLYLLLALILPCLQLLLGSLQKTYGVYSWQGFTLDNYQQALTSALVQRALRNTLLLALLGGLLAMTLSTCIAYILSRTRYSARKGIELAVWAPWTMPGVVLGVGILWAYISVPGLKELYGTPWFLLIGVVVTVIPVGVRMMTSAMGQLSKDLEEAARIHGASWRKTLTSVVLRLVAPTFMYGWLVVGVLIGGELSVPLVLYSPGNEVLSVAIYSLQQTRKEGVAAAVFSMLLLTVMVLFAVVKITQALRAASKRRRAIAVAPAPIPAISRLATEDVTA